MNKKSILILLMCIIISMVFCVSSFGTTENVVTEVALYDELIASETVEDMYATLLQNQSIVLSELTIEELKLLKEHAEEIYLVNRR